MKSKKALLSIVCIFVLLLTACKAETSGTEKKDVPIEPFYLDQLTKTEEEVFSELNLSKDNVDAFSWDGYRIREKETEICEYVFDDVLFFTKALQGDVLRMYEFDYVLNVDDLSKDEIFSLSQDISALISDTYGSSDTHFMPEFCIENWEGAEDIDLDKVRNDFAIYREEWYFPVPDSIKIPEGSKTDETVYVCLMLNCRDAAHAIVGDATHVYLNLQYRIMMR